MFSRMLLCLVFISLSFATTPTPAQTVNNAKPSCGYMFLKKTAFNTQVWKEEHLLNLERHIALYAKRRLDNQIDSNAQKSLYLRLARFEEGDFEDALAYVQSQSKETSLGMAVDLLLDYISYLENETSMFEKLNSTQITLLKSMINKFVRVNKLAILTNALAMKARSIAMETSCFALSCGAITMASLETYTGLPIQDTALAGFAATLFGNIALWAKIDGYDTNQETLALRYDSHLGQEVRTKFTRYNIVTGEFY